MNMQKHFDRIANGIVGELLKPQNLDLLIAVRDHDLDNTGGGFMFGFQSAPPLNFDQFCNITHQVDAIIQTLKLEAEPDYRSMSTRYDEYIVTCNDNKRLNLEQSARFEVMIKPFDDGWSGAVFGLLMRQVQLTVLRMFNN